MVIASVYIFFLLIIVQGVILLIIGNTIKLVKAVYK